MIRFTLLLCLCSLTGSLYSQARWLVRYAPGHTRSSLSELSFFDAEEVPLYPGSAWRRWDLGEDPDQALLARLQSHAAVASLEREIRYRSQAVPSDPGFTEQWALQNTGQTGGPLGVDLRATDAWSLVTGSESVTIAVIDAGVDWRHPDLAENIWQNLGEDADGDGVVLVWDGSRWIFDPGDENGIDDDGNGYVDDFIGWDFVNDDNDPSDDHRFGHGTHVGGIIAARGDNGIGISGVSWRSQLMPLKFLDSNGGGFTGDAIAALQYARQMGARLSNHSWGGGLFSQALRDELLLADQAGLLCVAAAGNNFGNNNDEAPLYPASYALDNVISVSASDPVDSLAPFANRGFNSVDLCAPGYGIYSTLPGGEYGYLNGTSMAAPFVTGALALLLSQQPDLSPAQLRQQLLRSTPPRPGLIGTCATEGRLDLLALLQQPVLFQQELPGSVYGGAALGGGDLLAVGEQQGNLWAARLRPDGQVAWTRRDQAGAWATGTAAPAEGCLLGGQANGQPLLTRLDSLGAPLWTQTLNWGSAAGLTQLASDGSRVWAAGWYLDNGDTSLWVARFGWDGQVQLRRRYGLSGQHLRPVAMALEDGAPGLLLRLGTNGSVWLRLDTDGSLAGVDQLSWPGAVATLAQSLSVQDEEWSLTGQVLLGSGERQLFSLEWESDDGYDGSVAWSLGQTNGPSVGSAGHAHSQWLLSTGAGGQGPGLRLLHVDSDGDAVLNRSYAWPGEAVAPVWVGPSRPGLIAWLLRRPGGGSYWGQTDEQGNSFCFTDSVRTMAVPDPLFTVVPVSLDNLGTAGDQSTATLSPQGSAGTSTLLCDNSGCEIRAYFTLPDLETCEGGSLIPVNLSENATAYQWWLDGAQEDTLAAPILEAPDDEGHYELVLVALDGACIDTFRAPIRVVADLQLEQVDTVHCGPRLTLVAPEASFYRWRNADDSLLSEAERFTFGQSGNYVLELGDACGEVFEVAYSISLQGDCVWPGDVSADGQVNLVDYLLLGLVHGQSGPPRANATTDYAPQTATPWADSFASSNPWAAGINLVHADANGDGLIDAESDGALVRQHYRADRLPQLAPDPLAEIEVGLSLDTTVIRSGDTVGFQVELISTNGQPIPDAYGLALTLESSIPLSQPMEVSPQGSWLTTGSSSDTLVLREPGSRRLRVGLNRLDRVAAAPSAGLVMSGIIIVVIDDIGSYGALAERGFLSLAVTEALLIRPDGSRIALNPLGTQAARTLQVLRPEGNPVGVEPTPTLAWQVFPNPTQGRVQVKTGRSPNQPGGWILRSLQGKSVAEGEWPAHQPVLDLDLRQLPAGYYLLQVEQHGAVHHAKVWLQR